MRKPKFRVGQTVYLIAKVVEVFPKAKWLGVSIGDRYFIAEVREFVRPAKRRKVK